MGNIDTTQIAYETWLRVEVECRGIQLPPEPAVDNFLRDRLGSASKIVTGTDLFHEVYPSMEARLIRCALESGAGDNVVAGKTYRNMPTRRFICAGEDVAFEPFFFPLEGDVLQAARSGEPFYLELRLIHTPRTFRSEILLATFSFCGDILPAGKTVKSQDSSGCEIILTCSLLDAAGSQKILACSSNFTLVEILSKLTPILAGPRGIEVLLAARPTELRSGDESAAHAELDKLSQELRNTMSNLKVPDDSSEGRCYEADMIDSLKLLTRGLLSFSDRFRTRGNSDLPELVVQWIKSFFKLCSGAADLSFNEGRLRRLLSAAQLQVQDLEPVEADGSVLAWAGRTDEKDPIKAWFRNARRINMSKEMEKAVIGTGSFGCVWRARNKLTGTLYAIKNVVPNSIQGKQLAAREAALLDVICAEKHPCIVGLFFVGCDPAKSMYAHVMELCSDGDLQAKIVYGRGCSGSYTVPALAKIWIGEIFMALAYLYLQLHVLHRDVKPNNVVLNKGVAKLVDFGLTNRTEEIAENCGQWTFNRPPGTRLFAAPEVLRQEHYDFKADLYSFGVVIWLLLTGGLEMGPYPPFDPHHKYENDCLQMQRSIEGSADERYVKEIHIAKTSQAEGSHRIEQITFLYSDGQKMACGDNEGQLSSNKVFLLHEGEYIKKIIQKGTGRKGNLWPAMIQFFTNTGRLSPAYGDESASIDYPSLSANASMQIVALIRSDFGRLKIVQDWAAPPQGLATLPPDAADLVLQLVRRDAQARPDYKTIWSHDLMRSIALPSITGDIDIEEITGWIASNTPCCEA